MAAPTRHYLDFERPIAELESKLEDLQKASESAGPGAIEAEVAALRDRVEALKRESYARLDPWQKTMVARHPNRPHFIDYVGALIDDFVELRGDRVYGDDQAIVGGLGRFRGRSVVVMGHEKGADTTSRLKHNFGMARPEGYRKAVRLMNMAERFGLPVVTFIDTAGAYPGVGAEERGQAEAIARSTERGLTLRVPMVATVTGEGGSGGAIALAAANKVLILEHSIYSVISPEGAASILWRDGARAKDAAEAMKITAQDLIALKIVDRIVREPAGGAHSDPAAAIEAVGDAVEEEIKALSGLSADALLKQRADRFYAIGRA
jgi:acetyl-CoA carboxylase carboxyl transferase subunit alpha